MIIDYQKDYFDFAKYVSSNAPISFEDAKMLYGIACLTGTSRDMVIEDLISNGGNVYASHKKMMNEMRLPHT